MVLNYTHGFCQWHLVIGEYGQQSFVTTHVGPVVEIILRTCLAVILSSGQPQLQPYITLDVGPLRPGF